MEWKFPISLPRFTDEDFKAKRERYIAEHGYTITAPHLSDIIHIKLNHEPDDEEFGRYDKARRLNYLIRTYPTSRSIPKWKRERDALISTRRYNSINDLMQRKRDKYNTMLASPSPNWIRNTGSVMTFFDDVNDMAGTAAVVCRIAAHFAPRILSRFFLGPAGWLLLIADIFGLMMSLTRLPIACVTGKRHFKSVTEMNPFSRKARAVRAKKLRRFLPGKGELIEAAQVTDQLFGIGLCLGPLVGFAEDIVAGTVRTIRGEKVSWHGIPPRASTPEQHALRTLRFAQMVGLAHDIMTEDEHWLYMVALNGATQVLKPYLDIWNPLDEVDGLDKVLFTPPEPRYATTKAIMEEFTGFPNSNIGWPGLNKKEATADELWNYYQAGSAESYKAFSLRNRRNYVGMTGAQNGYEFAKNMLLFASGYDTVEEDLAPGWNGWMKFYENGCEFTRCFSFWGSEVTRYELNLHYIHGCPVVVVCTDQDTYKFTGEKRPAGVMAPCGDEEIYIGPSFCMGKMKACAVGVHFKDFDKLKASDFVYRGTPGPI